MISIHEISIILFSPLIQDPKQEFVQFSWKSKSQREKGSITNLRVHQHGSGQSRVMREATRHSASVWTCIVILSLLHSALVQALPHQHNRHRPLMGIQVLPRHAEDLDYKLYNPEVVSTEVVVTDTIPCSSNSLYALRKGSSIKRSSSSEHATSRMTQSKSHKSHSKTVSRPRNFGKASYWVLGCRLSWRRIVKKYSIVTLNPDHGSDLISCTMVSL